MVLWDKTPIMKYPYWRTIIKMRTDIGFYNRPPFVYIHERRNSCKKEHSVSERHFLQRRVSKVMPSNFSDELLWIAWLLILASFFLFVLNSKWHLSEFAFIMFCQNQLGEINICVYLEKKLCPFTETLIFLTLFWFLFFVTIFSIINVTINEFKNLEIKYTGAEFYN